MSKIAKSCATVGELRKFLDNVPDEALLIMGSGCMPLFTASFFGSPKSAQAVDVELGDEHGSD